MGSSMMAILLLLAAGVHWVSVSNEASVTNPPPEQRQQMVQVHKETANFKQYAHAPEMTIDITKKYQAVIHTNKGDFTIELFAESAPNTVNNFIFLAKDGFYDHLVFHRIIKSFVIQTGDPKGDGTGGPGYQFKDELSTQYKYEPGIVAMANAGSNTNGSQFFICTGEDSTALNNMPNYTIFGKIVSGMETVQKIAATKVTEAPRTRELSYPVEQVIITSIEINEND